MWNFLQIGLLAVILWKVLEFKTPAVSRGKTKAILDSCALIDGRITELAKSGFMLDELIIPDFILHELQLLADGSDAHKRERARYGLDVARELQDMPGITVTLDREQIASKIHTDDKLVALAKKRGALLYTTDYNLGKIAAIEDVKVLNVNELAGALRPVLLPGEERIVKIVQKGSSSDQGVAYMEDGTMLVIDHGSRYIGKTVRVSVNRMHQTVAGKMIFAEIIEPAKTLAKSPQVAKTLLRQRLHQRATNR